ncbi:N-acetylmuramoyl-L-alanine amidase, partial [Brachybacterium squillarum]|uniref:N-acetylmuramoyl-L-alanine amidase n=1 Tax=Brachybacterium squillarum TaxID=661979 RepID=UPI000262A8B6
MSEIRPSAPESPARRGLSRRGLFAATAASVPATAVVAGTAPAWADPEDETRIIDVDLADAATTTVDGTTVREVAEEGVTMVGATWKGDHPDVLEVRGRLAADGSFTEWFAMEDLVSLEAEEESETQEATSAQAIWLGGACSLVQIRAELGGSELGEEITAHLIVTTQTAADEELAAQTNPRARMTYRDGERPGVGAPLVVMRDTWGANESLTSGSPRYASGLKAAVLHHSGGYNSYTAAEVPGLLRGYLAYHTQTNGWADLGYNALVDRFGTIYEGRAGGLERHVIGAHATGSNTGTVGVCMIGNHSSSSASSKALNAVAYIMAWKLGGAYVFDVDDRVTIDSKSQRRVFGHRDAASVSTACPGGAAYSQISGLRDLVQQRLDDDYRTSAYDAYLAVGGRSTLGTVSRIARVVDGVERTDFSTGCAILVDGDSVVVLDRNGDPFVDYDVSGVIEDKWLEKGGFAGLGQPTSEQREVQGGLQQDFAQGTITWSQATDAHVTLGSIGRKWTRAGGIDSVYGFPDTDESRVLNGTAIRQDYVSGSIFHKHGVGTFGAHGRIGEAWEDAGGIDSVYGMPISDERR